MVKWIHPVFGVFTVFVANAEECSDKHFEEMFNVFVNNFKVLESVVVVNDEGNQCLFHHDRIIEGFFELVKKDN